MTNKERAQRFSLEETAALIGAHDALQSENAKLKKRIAWFERQLFAHKSERRLVDDGAMQLSLGPIVDPGVSSPAPSTRTVATHERKVPGKKPLDNAVSDTGLRFGPNVPVQEIRLEPEQIQGLSPDAYDIIDEKITHKLAQQASSYVVLKYIQPVIKLKASQELISAPAPAAVLEKSYADVSFIAGALIDKFLYHQPLYRQHQKLERNHIALARGTLTTTIQRAIGLLEPIYGAQYQSILASALLAMDETPSKAGRDGNGKMKTGYFWPIYGDQDEVVFPFVDNRRHENVATLLKGFTGTLLTDGYAAYERYAHKSKILHEEPITHAHCWVHLRRLFLAAEQEHPDKVNPALAFIGLLYRHEAQCQAQALTGAAKRAHRQQHSAPIVAAFFTWLSGQQHQHGLLPRDDFTKALNFALQQRASFEHFLTNPDLPLDTNHLERALRVIPMGRKNWLFCWTELGAKQVGIIQSLLTTCTLHQINAYDYLVDVLQRVSQHPASRVHELTPRRWKQHFADNPLRSALHRATTQPNSRSR